MQEGVRICDGTQWSMFVRYEGSRGLVYSGDNTYPENWHVLLNLFGIDYYDENHNGEEDNNEKEHNDEDHKEVADGKNPEHKSDKVIYCRVSFVGGGRTFYYQTHDSSIKVGDQVIVPAGENNTEQMAVVKKIEYYKPTDVPYPLDKTKHIIKKQSVKEASNYSLDKFILCDEVTPRVKVKVWAEVSDGCLRISGQDLGKTSEDVFGNDEYEYFYEFDQNNTEHLFKLLTSKKQNIKDMLILKFGGMDGCSSLRNFCDTNGIKYRFFSC